MTDTVAGVLAEMARCQTGWHATPALQGTIDDWRTRLAAAHEREVGEARDDDGLTVAYMVGADTQRKRAEAAEALLHELQDALVPLAGPILDEFRRRLSGAGNG